MRATNLVLLPLLLLGSMLTIFGLAHISHSIGWGHDGRYNFAVFVSVCFCTIVLGSRYYNRPPWLIGVCIGLAITLIAGAWWPILAILWFVFASILLGHHALKLLGITFTERSLVLNFITGSGFYGTLISLFAHFPINYPWLYGICLLAPFLLNPQLVSEYVAHFRSWFLNHSTLAEDEFNWLDVLLTVLSLVYFVVALMPELGHDALAMHLFIPVHMVYQHQWGFDVSKYVWGVMPMLGDWIFTIEYFAGGETAARLINVFYVYISLCLIHKIVLWAGGDENSVRWSKIIFLSTPLTFALGSSLFIESIWAVYITAGAFVVFRYFINQQETPNAILLTAIFLGFALATKAVTLMFLPILFLVLLWRWKHWLKPIYFPSIAKGLVLFLALGLIPYISAYLKSGNPVFPFYNHVFQSEYFPVNNFDNSSIFGSGMSWDYLYRVTFHTGEFLESHTGGSGFQWLLLFLPASGMLLFMRNKKLFLIFAVAFLSQYLTFRSTSYIRYVFPEWLLFSVIMGCVLFNQEILRTRYSRFLKCAGGAAVGLNIIFINAPAFYGDFALKSILSEENRVEYLDQRMPIRNAIRMVNYLNKNRSPVAIFHHAYVAGLKSDALHCSWYNLRFHNLIDSTKNEEALAKCFVDEGVYYVILNSNWKYPEKLKMIKNITDEVLLFGDLSVRKLHSKYRFKSELLKSPNYEEINEWNLTENSTYDESEHTVSVNVDSPVYQVIKVEPRKQYLNSVTARSLTPKGYARLQVNWLDKRGKFISAKITPVLCSESWNSYSMQVVAPSNAESAIIYASGHTKDPVQFKKNSFLE